MTVTGNISNIEYPEKVAAGAEITITFHVQIFNTIPGAPSDNYQFLIDADTKEALKGNYIAGIGDYTRDEDIHTDMPNKALFNFYLELWTEVPDKYVGVDIEGVT